MKYLFFDLLCLFLINVVVSLDKRRDCKCRIQVKKRIIGGREADPMSYPWMVSLQTKEEVPVPDHLRKLVPVKTKMRLHFCGGSIIEDRWILTASHCVSGTNPNYIRVAYGSNDLVTHYDRKQYAEVKRIYAYNGILDDVALIELKSPLEFNEAVQPACLPNQPQEHYDGALQISGFGKTERPVDEQNGHLRDSGISRYLKEGKTYDHSDDPKRKCLKRNFICVENPVDSSCHQDSGGPLHYTKAGRSTVIGITSHGETDFNEETKETTYCVGRVAYSRISRYMDWIQKTVQDQLCV